MRLRPRGTRLFEVFTPRHQTVHALALLAQTGAVELDAFPNINAGLEVRATLEAIRAFDQIADQYRDSLPEQERRPYALDEPPEQVAQRAKVELQRWVAEIEPVLARLREFEVEHGNLILLQEYADAASSGLSHHDLSLLSHPAGLLHKGLYACPQQQALPDALTHVFREVSIGAHHRFLILVGLQERAPEIERAVQAGTCYPLEVPAWLASNSIDWPAQLGARLAVLENDIAAMQRAIESIKNDAALRAALADIALLKWYTQQAVTLSMDEKFCRIAGWTSFSDQAQLEAVLHQQGIAGFVRFLLNPAPRSTPVETLDTWWARPFQPFIQMYGTPEAGEVDPSAVLVFVVPLLFGYMFPDVGHGLLLVAFSVVMYRRWPEGRFLIPCGLVAMVFGFVFGEVFGFDDLLSPLWLKPLEQPMMVLLAPLVFGVGLITLGLVFAGVQSYWRGELRYWLLADAALLVLYFGALTAPFHAYGRYAATGALLWFLAGSLILNRVRPAYRLGGALGGLLESLFQLAVNTLSFLRVGAFALAHAAISSAMLMVATTMPNRLSYWVVLIAAQLLAMVFETLVVFVQTTRLVFFEFFVRFLRAEGRIFKPLHPPQARDG